MTHASLFTGIGGFDLAAERAGLTNIFQVEKDPWCLKVLAKNFPRVTRYGDITSFNAKPYENKIDVLTGGFPCQPFSIANAKRKGKKDNRYLWPEMFRVIKQIKPAFIIGENVPGIIKLALDKVLTDLESIGYTTETFVIPACSQNAPHKRDRVWIIAYSQKAKNQLTRWNQSFEKSTASRNSKDLVFPDPIGLRRSQRNNATINEKKRFHNRRTPSRRNYWKTKPRICRVADGIPHRLDRIKGLGNAIVPQVAERIFSYLYSIKETAP